MKQHSFLIVIFALVATFLTGCGGGGGGSVIPPDPNADKITATIRDSNYSPLPGVTMVFLDAAGQTVGSAVSQADGTLAIKVTSAVKYMYVSVVPASVYKLTWYSNRPNKVFQPDPSCYMEILPNPILTGSIGTFTFVRRDAGPPPIPEVCDGP